jgi:hypothetical protein
VKRVTLSIPVSCWNGSLICHPPSSNNKVSKVHPCTGTEALYRSYGPQGSRGIVLLFHDHGPRRSEGSASHPSRSLPLLKSRYPLYRRLGGPQGRSEQVRKISPPTGIQSPDRLACSQSLYRLRYPAPITIKLVLNCNIKKEWLFSEPTAIW